MLKVKNDYLRQDLVELTVANFYAYDKSTGVEYFSGTLKSHELSASGENTKVKSGQDNSVQYVIPKDKEFTLKTTDVWSRQDIIAKKFGSDIKVVGSEDVYKMHMPKNYTLKSEEKSEHYVKCVLGDEGALKIIGSGEPQAGEVLKASVTPTLPDAVAGDYVKLVEASSQLYIMLVNEPMDGENFIVYNNKTNEAIEPSKVVVDGTDKKKFAILETGLVIGDTVFVTGFKTKAKATEHYSNITSDSKMPELFVCVEIPVFNSSNEVEFVKQYIFPRCQMNSSVSSKGESEKKEVSDETTIDILKDKTLDYLGRIIYVEPEESISSND